MNGPEDRVKTPYSIRDEPLSSTDLSVCYRVLSGLRDEYEIDHASDQYELLAATVIEHYRRGVRDEQSLRNMVRQTWDAKTAMGSIRSGKH